MAENGGPALASSPVPPYGYCYGRVPRLRGHGLHYDKYDLAVAKS
ncbi:MAG TPA: hypothetical protein VNH11_23845 [Pirellulales bacterium]|nr:hypothetical protein [Pirellulales bacterium]